MLKPEKKKKKWTLMFFFASDNTLSPSVLSQLKQIKAAGSQDDTNVIVYFDPNEMGAPTRVFKINKNDTTGPAAPSGDSGGLVSALTADNISPAEIGKAGPESENFARSLQPVDNLKADAALKQFLGFCRETYPAEHYMLFLLGHGLVVGRDAFLSDDNPDTAIGLKTLGEILKTFSDQIKQKQGVLELIGMHSCSMSAIEVAYQLKGTANYMLASEGLSFVGSWPYRQLLTKIYTADTSTDYEVLELVKSLHSLCIQYSVDFMYAGYSSDICLCSLDPERVETLTDPISTLAQALKEGLTDDRCQELIVLAHLKSQSYWQETYSDIFDFCWCLHRLSVREREKSNQRRSGKNGSSGNHSRGSDAKLDSIIDACTTVIEALTPRNGQPADGPIVCTDYIGPDCQYSHGLSIYFPWSKPLEDANDQVLKNYQSYSFTRTTSSGAVSWWEFLESYFEKTQRDDRLKEDDSLAAIYQTDQAYKNAIDAGRVTFAQTVASGGRELIPVSALEGKVSPPDSGGGACTCASTKNYSRVFSMSRGAATIFPATVSAATAATATRSKPAQRRSRSAGR